MTGDGPIWFVPRRYGYGANPVTWQGWAITVAFILLALWVIAHFKGQPLIEFALLIPATIVLLVVIAKTTRGGWRWRWGEDD